MKCIQCNQETGAAWKTLCRSCWKKQTPDEIRAYRQKKLDKKVARLKAKADKLNALGDQKKAAMEAYHGDIAFFTQPNINSSSGRAFTRQRERIYSRFDAGMRLQIEADELKKKAEWLEKQGVAVKGDAERERQAKRDANDKIIFVGSRVSYPGGDEGEVIKVNKKTYTVKFDRGFTLNQDKSWAKLVKEKVA